MTNNYQYSIKVNEALERYGAKTCGTLARRVERLKRFTDMKNNAYADEIKVEHARMIANQEREERMKNRIREIATEGTRYGRRANAGGARRNLLPEFKEASQEADVPMTPSRYNLRSRANDYGLQLLLTAIENGFVNSRRG